MFSLALSLIALSPIAQANDARDEFSFIMEGEKNRALNEADRAPNASLFLEDDDDDDANWAPAPTSAATSIDVDDAIETVPNQPIFDRIDPEEDTVEFGPDMSELTPLVDHLPITIERSSLGIVVAELPVLVARN